jgi:hypothetical protein
VLRGLPADAVPDLTVRDAYAPPCAEADLRQPLEAWVCNRGTLPVAAGVTVSFRFDAVDGPLACTAATGESLAPGECVRVSCDWEGVPIGEPHDVYVVVDESDEPPGAVPECREDNNRTSAAAVRCPPGIG